MDHEKRHGRILRPGKTTYRPNWPCKSACLPANRPARNCTESEALAPGRAPTHPHTALDHITLGTSAVPDAAGPPHELAQRASARGASDVPRSTPSRRSRLRGSSPKKAVPSRKMRRWLKRAPNCLSCAGRTSNSVLGLLRCRTYDIGGYRQCAEQESVSISTKRGYFACAGVVHRAVSSAQHPSDLIAARGIRRWPWQRIRLGERTTERLADDAT
jgi:hypothetical protein